MPALPIPNMRRNCKISKETYLRFLRYPNLLHNEESIEFGIRCISELNLFHSQTGQLASVSSFYNPYIMNTFAESLLANQISLQNATKMFAKWIKHLPSALEREWAIFIMYNNGPSEVDSVGHYVFVAVKNIPLVFDTLWGNVQSSKESDELELNLLQTLRVTTPQLFIIDSLRGRNKELFRRVLAVVRIMFSLKWNLATTRSNTRSRSERARKRKTWYDNQLNSVLEEVQRFYRMALVNIHGPSQGESLTCGSFVITHFSKAQQEGYLESVIKRAGEIRSYPLRGNAGGMKIPRAVSMPELFSAEDVAVVNNTIVEFIESLLQTERDVSK